MRTDGLGDVFDLLHHFFINMKTAGRIKHRNIAAVLAGILDALTGNLDGIGGVAFGINRHPDLVSERFELVDSSRTLKVVGNQTWLFAFGDKILSQFGSGGGFA